MQAVATGRWAFALHLSRDCKSRRLVPHVGATPLLRLAMPASILPLYRRRSSREAPALLSPQTTRVKALCLSICFAVICLTALAALSTRRCFLPNSDCSRSAGDSYDTLGALPAVSWSLLHGAVGDRDAVLHVHNLCVSPRHGVFYLEEGASASSTVPEVNMIASAPELDKLWAPSKLALAKLPQQNSFRYLSDTTLFVMGSIWPSHMSHFYINNGFPLLDVMRTFFQDWDFTGTWMQHKRHLGLINGKEDLFEAIDSFKFDQIFDAKSAKEAGASEEVTCYANAVIGLNSTCAHNFCKNEHGDKGIYKFMHQLVWNHYLSLSEAERAKGIAAGKITQSQHAVIVQRKANRYMVNADEIAAAFKQHDISCEIVHLEGMTYRDQVKLFSLKATVIVGVHGNAIGHFLLAQPHTLVIEIFQLDWHSDWQELVVKQTWKAVPPHTTDIRYAKIECNDKSCSEGMTGLQANVRVNISRLNEIIADQVVPHI